MATILDPAREQAVRDWLDGEFLKPRRDPSSVPRRNDVAIGPEWRLEADAPDTPLLRRTLANARRFFEHCMKTPLTGSGVGKLVLALDGAGPDGEESFRLSVRPGAVRVSARRELGLLRGAMRVLRTCANRKAPFMPAGAKDWTPAFAPRIANTVFCPGAQSLRDAERQFSDGNLSLMSYFDLSGVHANLNLWEYSRSAILPELDAPEAERHLADLRGLVARAAEFGIAVYPVVNAPPLSADHAVFQRHPEIRGARVFMGEDFANGVIPCTSAEAVREYFAEVLGGMFAAVPGLGGAIFIVGGESFTHCYTRPAPPFEGRTNCPRCAGADPAERVAALMNRIAAAVHAQAPAARIFCWPYSAFTWSGEDRCQIELIRHLSPEVLFLSNWDSGDRHPKTGAALYDYNIVEIGPSSMFAEQRRALAAAGRPHYAKIECATTPLMFQVPYLPLPYRWAERVRRLRREKAAGYVCHWRFYGFTGCLPEELLAEGVWREETPAAALRRYSRREFGECPPALLRGWRTLGRAWDQLPYSACLVGERQFYQKGPMYLGPAHPFILDPQKPYNLSRGFVKLRGDAEEAFADMPFAERERLHGVPAYSSDLFWTLPVGVDRAVGMLDQAVKTWEQGLAALATAFRQPNEVARRELGLCRLVGIHLRTALHLGRFYRLRDRFLTRGLRRPEELAALTGQMQEILAAEIANAEAALPILEADPRLGYGFCYGIVYDAPMVREKIAQCRFVMDRELPMQAKDLRFHLYSMFP